MPGKVVGISVVVHVFRVFIRPNHVMDFETPFDVGGPPHPERRGFHQQRHPFITHKGVILRRLPVSDDGPGNICHDVMFGQRGGHLLAYPRANIDRRELWRLFLPACCAFPGEQRARPAVTTGLRACAREVQPAVTQQTACYLRTVEQMERQKEYFGIPEDVAFIALTGQPFGRDAASFVMGRRHGCQMPDRVIQRHLVLMFRGCHLHPAIAPDLLPGAG
ncbi:Uncharacterised protein [Leclercia adecarboxylata]|nr:Uncharacterised protein [Leclercia adecarboxylata]